MTIPQYNIDKGEEIMKSKIIKIDGEEYIAHPTRPFKTSFGTAGSKGFDIFTKIGVRDMGHYNTLAEFRKDRAFVKKMMKVKK